MTVLIDSIAVVIKKVVLGRIVTPTNISQPTSVPQTKEKAKTFQQSKPLHLPTSSQQNDITTHIGSTTSVSTLGAGYDVAEPSSSSTPNSTSGTKQSLASGETVLDSTKISTLDAVPGGHEDMMLVLLLTCSSGSDDKVEDEDEDMKDFMDSPTEPTPSVGGLS
ncbi:hypothetical protein INT45_000982 [Circinella minor]|uniref:Uncharacterized protein n=1 Tax=Circinella minor TaxID=1195481 RepID=A0A8H7VF84_9FUNG|nr:hypothetical protein INT45_000982 [Circinella minor]